MRYSIFILLLSTNVYAKKITLNIPDTEIAVVENDVVDAEKWIQDAWEGKYNKCKERLIKGEIERSIQNNEIIPPGEGAVINKALNRPDYKNRKARDLELPN